MGSMAEAGPSASRCTAEEYFRLVGVGVLRPDDRVELLDGVIVAVSPQNPRHASAVRRAQRLLEVAIAGRAVLSVQLPFVAGGHSVPEPDVAVLPGREPDYDRAHPTTALLVVEVADGSLIQDRLTKAAIYAAASIPEYWIVNLRDDCVEVFRDPDRQARQYRHRRLVGRGEAIELLAFADASVSVSDLLPARD